MNPETVSPVVAPGGRSVGRSGRSTGGGRLKNHAGNSLSSLYCRVMIAEPAGAGEYQSARTSQLCGVAAPPLTIGCAGANVTHQPSCTNATAITAFQASSAMMQVLAN